MAIQLQTTDELSKLFRKVTGINPLAISPLAESGSNRKYYRLTNGETTLIGVYNPIAEENEAFFYLSSHFENAGLNVPQILAVSSNRLYYLQNDLGNQSLFDLVSHVVNWNEPSALPTKNLLLFTVDELVKFQTEGFESIDTARLYSHRPFDNRSIFWDLNYFKYSFLKPAGTLFNDDALENDFETLSKKLLQAPADFFMYRDFQSRNVMILNEVPHFIDYQGGRIGPALYDIASFVYQARANFPKEIRNELFQRYLEQLAGKREVDIYKYVSLMPYFALFRTLQVLGAYGYRGFFERKSHFLLSIPNAVMNLNELLENLSNELPHLANIGRMLQNSYSKNEAEQPNFRGLTIHISSFSFKKGYPSEHPVHGGGFVFDCRGLPNPGRLAEFATLTGLDKKTANFLAKHREVEKFFDTTLSLIRATIEVYKSRGFEHLEIAFGCTGGQHRSVYMASRLAELFNNQDGVRVLVKHRELEG